MMDAGARGAKPVAGDYPSGLLYLAITELLERFSFYGMLALLPLYLQSSLLPGRASETVLGLAALRSVFEISGSISDGAFGSLIVGWYGGLVYFTPILGGLTADKWLGTTRSIVTGLLLMTIGHVAMASDRSFLVALALLIAGSGLLKGNISAQLGALYPPGAASMRERGYTLFSTGINVGSLLGPVACGTVAAVYGWRAGFALAASAMLAAAAVYLAGRPHYPAEARLPRNQAAASPVDSLSRGRLPWLAALIGILALPSASYSMIWNVGLIWIAEKVDLSPFLGTIPASWFAALDSLSSILAAPFLVMLWARQARLGREAGSLAKIAIGCGLIGISAAIFALGHWVVGEGSKVPVAFALAGYLGMGVGFMFYWPAALAVVSEAAPPGAISSAMGVAFLAPFVGSVMAGWGGTWFNHLSAGTFWLLNAATAWVGMVLIINLRDTPGSREEPLCPLS